MTNDIEKNNETTKKVRSYIINAIDKFKNEDPNKLVDILGDFDNMSKIIKKFIDDKKKEVILKENTFTGERYRLNKSSYFTYSISPQKWINALKEKRISKEEFNRAVKVNNTIVKQISKELFEKIKTEDSETEKFVFVLR